MDWTTLEKPHVRECSENGLSDRRFRQPELLLAIRLVKPDRLQFAAFVLSEEEGLAARCLYRASCQFTDSDRFVARGQGESTVRKIEPPAFERAGYCQVLTHGILAPCQRLTRGLETLAPLTVKRGLKGRPGCRSLVGGDLLDL